MIYTWKCAGCGEKVEVKRSLSEYMRGPEGDEAQHAGCTGTRFKKLVSKPSRIFVHDNEAYYSK